MDPQRLVDRYGGRIVFWGGGVDTQKTLPFGTPDEVRAEVARTVETFGRTGGYVFNTIHNTQAKTPVENFVAMIETVNRHR
jgi:uroporphyrinogen-III decarboxylase